MYLQSGSKDSSALLNPLSKKQLFFASQKYTLPAEQPAPVVISTRFEGNFHAQ
jgi:hypothetical protein